MLQLGNCRYMQQQVLAAVIEEKNANAEKL